MQPASLSSDDFKSVQLECTETLSRHMLQLQKALREANELHHEQLKVLRHLVQVEPLENKRDGPRLGQGVSSVVQGYCNKTEQGHASKSTVFALGESSISDPREERKFLVQLDDHLEAGKAPKARGGNISESAGQGHRPRKQKLNENSCLSSADKDTDCFVPEPSSRSRTVNHNVDSPLRVNPGRFLTWGAGFSGRKKLLSYNFDEVQAYAAIPMLFNRGNIFWQRPSLLIQMLCQPVLIGIVWLVSSAGANDFAQDAGLLKLTDALTRLAPFVLGFFIISFLRRWWLVRAQYIHKFHTSASQISSKLGLVLPDSAEKIRLQIERYLLASHKMIYMSARHNEHFDELVTTGLLTAQELEHIRFEISQSPESIQGQIGSFDLAIAKIPVTWSAQLIYRLFKFSSSADAHKVKLDFPSPMMMQMLSHCAQMKSSIMDMEMILNSPLPFPYVHAVVLVVHCLAIFSCIRAGVELVEVEDLSSIHFISRCICVMSLNSLYTALLCTAALLLDPFGDEYIDFPASNFHCRMWKAQVFSRCMIFPSSIVDEHISRILGKPDGKVAGARVKDDDDVDHELEQEEASDDDDEAGVE